MMKWNPHLSFKGQCEAAFKFYEKCLDGKITLMMTYGDSPLAGETPLDWGKKIIHATFALNDQVLTGADVVPDSYQKPCGFSILLNIDAAAEADRIFRTLAENGEVQLPLQETFWALRFGMFTDQFGTPWMINCGKAA
jgi:PhnB protein